MLEICAVVDSRREQYADWCLAGSGREMLQGLEEKVGVIVYRPYPIFAVELWKRPFHGLAVFQQVRNAGWATRIVLEN